MLRFMNLVEEFSLYELSKFVVIPVPYERSTTYGKGTVNGPNAILLASHEIEPYDYESGTYPAKKGIHTIPYSIEEYNIPPEDMITDLSSKVDQVLKDHKIPVVLGGEHTISLGVVKGLVKSTPDLTVIHLDAHADLKDEFEGDPFNHACVMRRVREVVDNTIHIGIRSLDEEEHRYLLENKIPVYFEDKFDVEEVINKIPTDKVYLTIDLDVLDPSIMPAVGTPEPNGLSWEGILSLIRRITEEKEVIGFDVVELSPINHFSYPDYTAAKLVYKTIGYISQKLKA